MIAEGSLEVKLPTIWADEAAEVGRGREEKKSQEKESAERRSSARKGRKVAKHYFSQCFVAPKGRKVGSLPLQLRMWSPGGRRDQELHAVVARSRFGGRVKMLKTPHSHAHTFRS